MIALAGLAVSLTGTVASGQQAAQQQRFQAATQRQAAERARQLAAMEERNTREAGESALSSLRARLAASGIQLTTGQALTLQENQASEGEFRALLARNQGMVQAAEAEAGAISSEASAQAAATSSFFNAGSTLLSGSGRILKSVQEG